MTSDECLALFRERFTNCPACGKPIEFVDTTHASGERTLDVLHPQPACAGFKAFTDRLLQQVSPRHRHGTLV